MTRLHHKAFCIVYEFRNPATLEDTRLSLWRSRCGKAFEGVFQSCANQRVAAKMVETVLLLVANAIDGRNQQLDVFTWILDSVSYYF